MAYKAVPMLINRGRGRYALDATAVDCIASYCEAFRGIPVIKMDHTLWQHALPLAA